MHGVAQQYDGRRFAYVKGIRRRLHKPIARLEPTNRSSVSRRSPTLLEIYRIRQHGQAARGHRRIS